MFCVFLLVFKVFFYTKSRLKFKWNDSDSKFTQMSKSFLVKNFFINWNACTILVRLSTSCRPEYFCINSNEFNWHLSIVFTNIMWKGTIIWTIIEKLSNIYQSISDRFLKKLVFYVSKKEEVSRKTRGPSKNVKGLYKFF